MDDPREQKIDRRQKIALLIVSSLTVVAIAAAAMQENVFAEWHQIRARYATRLEAKATDEPGHAAARLFEISIVQNYVPGLNAVDRCITCHVGVEDPRMADEEQPFRTHPGRYLELHDPAKFGCTVCHQGQGRATKVADGHGRVPYWDHPLLESRYVQASCTKCHATGELFGIDGQIARAAGETAKASESPIARGKRLADEHGCLGCHAIAGKGGSIGPDITHVGAKTRHDFVFAHFPDETSHQVTTWLEQHFLAPARISPGSIMPAVASQTDAEALTAYMLTLRGRETPEYVYERRIPEASIDGATLYSTYCSACHGPRGHGSRVEGIHTPALNNPDTLAVASDDYLRGIIADGRSGSSMPAWGQETGGLSNDEIDRIVAHIRGWEPIGPRLDLVASDVGDPASGAAYYRGLCAGCHGSHGEGGVGNALASDTFLAVADDDFLARAIVNGRPGTAMPSWRRLSSGAVSDILAYIRTWQGERASYDEVRAALVRMPAAENARIGRYVYLQNCGSCHGDAGEGGIGPSLASPSFLGAVDDVYLYRAITEGRPTTAMPAWRHLSADDVAALIAYLRAFAPDAQVAAPGRVPVGDYTVGKVYFELSCAGCHGQEAVGGTGPQLSNAVFLDSVSNETLFTWIAYGRAGSAMKGFLPSSQGPTRLTVEQIGHVIAYLRHLSESDSRPILRSGVGNPKLGGQLYAFNCASCHGREGEGASGPQLNNPAFLKTASDGFLAATLVLGRTGTPMKSMVHGQEGLGQIAPQNVQDVIAFLRMWEFPETWRKPRSVVETNPSAVDSGARAYARYCAGCHGPNGLGAGEGEGYFAPALNNPQFLAAASDGFLLATIARGRDGTPMRPFGEGAGGIVSLDWNEINEIVSFVRSWQAPAGTATGG